MVFINGSTSTEVNKGTLLSEVCMATVRKCNSHVKGVWVEGEMYHLWKYVYGVRKSKSWFRPCVSVFNLRMRVCSSINLSVLLEKSPFNITHSRSQIEWSVFLECLATGSPLLLSRKLFFVIVHMESNDGRCLTYVAA